MELIKVTSSNVAAIGYENGIIEGIFIMAGPPISKL